MLKVTKNQIAKANQINLLSYLREFESSNLVSKGNDYCTKEHDSLSISDNGLWHWCSRGIGGKNALSYLVKVKEVPFVDAVLILTGEKAQSIEPRIIPKTKQRKEFVLPKPFMSNNQVINYLQKRGITKQVIDYCISNKLIYESKDYHNAVFVGYDGKGEAKYGALRGTWEKAKKQFKGEIEGSDKQYSFSIKGDSNKLIVSESAIDVLSVFSLTNDANFNYLSIGGAYAPKKEISEAKLPVALTAFLENNKHIKKIVLCLDNDKTGIGASHFIGRKLSYMGYIVKSRPPQKDKDYNDLVVNRKKSSPSYER